MDWVAPPIQASANSIQGIPLRGLISHLLSTLPILAIFACGLPVHAYSADLSKAHDPHFESDPLAELADVVECRASTGSINNLREGYLHSLGHPDSSPRYSGWKRTPTLGDKSIEIELPTAINVFGMSTKKVVLTNGSFRAILDGVPLKNVIDLAGLEYRKSTFGIGWGEAGIKPVALRNLGSGAVHVRAVVAGEIWNEDAVSVGCSDFQDSRQQQRYEAGLDSPFEFGAETDSLKKVSDILSCRANRRDDVRFVHSILKKPARNPFIKNWKHKYDETGSEWTLPRPIKVDGVTISKIWLVGDGIAGVAEGTTPAQLGRRWMMEETQNDTGDQLFLRKLNDRVASDGWVEERERFALQWDPGVTVTGCNYGESYPEYGWWPEEEENEDGGNEA